MKHESLWKAFVFFFTSDVTLLFIYTCDVILRDLRSKNGDQNIIAIIIKYNAIYWVQIS